MKAPACSWTKRLRLLSAEPACSHSPSACFSLITIWTAGPIFLPPMGILKKRSGACNRKCSIESHPCCSGIWGSGGLKMSLPPWVRHSLGRCPSGRGSRLFVPQPSSLGTSGTGACTILSIHRDTHRCRSQRPSATGCRSSAAVLARFLNSSGTTSMACSSRPETPPAL